MDTETMIIELRRLEEKHKNDIVHTFQNNWSLMCHDVANRLEELQNELNQSHKELDELQKQIDNSHNMNELLKALNYLQDFETENSDGCEYFKTNPAQTSEENYANYVSELCCELLISDNGGCNYENISILRNNGYDVFAGEKDSFGWLTGCVQKEGSNKILVYG